jgi:hypothetical protein
MACDGSESACLHKAHANLLDDVSEIVGRQMALTGGRMAVMDSALLPEWRPDLFLLNVDSAARRYPEARFWDVVATETALVFSGLRSCRAMPNRFDVGEDQELFDLLLGQEAAAEALAIALVERSGREFVPQTFTEQGPIAPGRHAELFGFLDGLSDEQFRAWVDGERERIDSCELNPAVVG